MPLTVSVANIKSLASKLLTSQSDWFSSFSWEPSWYQDEMVTIDKIKTGLVKPVCGKRQMEKCVGGRKVTITIRGKIMKMVTQQRDLTIYTGQMLYLPKLIFNI